MAWQRRQWLKFEIVFNDPAWQSRCSWEFVAVQAGRFSVVVLSARLKLCPFNAQIGRCSRTLVTFPVFQRASAGHCVAGLAPARRQITYARFLASKPP